MREWICGAGCPKGNEHIYMARYESHNNEGLEHFETGLGTCLRSAARPEKGGTSFCGFLGCDAPNKSFLHANRAAFRQIRKASSIHFASRLGRKARTLATPLPCGKTKTTVALLRVISLRQRRHRPLVPLTGGEKDSYHSRSPSWFP